MAMLIKLSVQFVAVVPRAQHFDTDGTFFVVHTESERLRLTYILSAAVCTRDGVNHIDG